MAFYSKKNRIPFINIVSLIDILVLLLIFFIVTTTFKQEEPAVKIQLPKSKQGAKSELENPIIIHVTQDNKIFWEGEVVTLDQLITHLKNQQIQSKRKVALKADEKSDFGLIVQVLDAFKEAGIENVPAFTQPLKARVP